jgi:hypothetical protein
MGPVSGWTMPTNDLVNDVFIHSMIIALMSVAVLRRLNKYSVQSYLQESWTTVHGTGCKHIEGQQPEHHCQAAALLEKAVITRFYTSRPRHFFGSDWPHREDLIHLRKCSFVGRTGGMDKWQNDDSGLRAILHNMPPPSLIIRKADTRLVHLGLTVGLGTLVTPDACQFS